MRTHNGKISSLKENQIFVFGSNLRGIHGAGAAALAHRRFGARWDVGEGMTGNCYALPTKDENIVTRSLNDIQVSVNRFITCARMFRDNDFLLTEVGCGLAGLKVEEIAPLFEDGRHLTNIVWPKSFVNVLSQDHNEITGL